MAEEGKKKRGRTPNAGVKKGSRQWDYAPIRTAYIEGIEGEDGKRLWPTFREVAERFGCPAGNLRARAGREKWSEAKSKFKADLEQAARAKSLKRLSDEATDFDLAALKAAKAGIAECTRHFIRINKQRQLDPEASYPERDLEAVGRALAGFHKTGRLAMGQPTESTETSTPESLDLKKYRDMPPDLRRRKLVEVAERLAGAEEGS